MATVEANACPLAVSDVIAGYGSKTVLNGISFSLNPGEIFGLVGLNGVGKTTLIRSILGLRSATSGDIAIFGQASSAASARRNVVYLPEKFQPSQQLSGWEHLSILLRYFGQHVDRAQALALADGLDLAREAVARRVRTYSKGMGQKLGLLGSLLVDAKLMILDEPMSGLDPRARALLKDRLFDARKAGRSIFFSSHILSDIEEMCDRIGVLHGGRIIFLGTPKEFIGQYAAPTLERAFLLALEQTDREAVA